MNRSSGTLTVEWRMHEKDYNFNVFHIVLNISVFTNSIVCKMNFLWLCTESRCTNDSALLTTHLSNHRYTLPDYDSKCDETPHT